MIKYPKTSALPLLLVGFHRLSADDEKGTFVTQIFAMHTYTPQKPPLQSNADAVAREKNESTSQITDHRPEGLAQRQLQQVADQSMQVTQAAQLRSMVVAQLSGKGNPDKKAKQEKEKRERASREQSKKDRNLNNFTNYSGSAAKTMLKNKSAKEVQDDLEEAEFKGHGSKNSGSKQNAATTKALGKLSEKQKQEKQQKKEAKKAKKQQDADQSKKKWLDRSDDNDNGGAGFGHGVLVSAQ